MKKEPSATNDIHVIKYVCILLTLHASLPAWGRNQDFYGEITANAQCDVFFLRSFHPFNITETHSPSATLIPPPPAPKVLPTVLPETVIETSKTVGSVTSVTSIASGSVSTVTQASRINALSNILSCQDDFIFETKPLDWSSSPTQISIGDGILRYVDGAVLGNWVIFAAISAAFPLASIKLGAWTVTHYPGVLALPALFLSTATAQAAVTMIRLGSTAEVALGSLSLLAQLSVIGGMAYRLLPSRFGAVAKKIQINPILSFLSKCGTIGHSIYNMLPSSFKNIDTKKWVAKEETPDYVKKNGLLFKEYRPEKYWFFVPECIMTMATGALNSVQIEPKSSCNRLLYAATTIYGTYAASLVILSPYMNRFDCIYFGSVTSAQAATLIISVVQRSVPSLQNSTTLEGIAEGIPVALQYITFMRGIYDIGNQAYNAHKYYNRHISKKKNPLLAEAALPFLNDFDEGEMLALPPHDTGRDNSREDEVHVTVPPEVLPRAVRAVTPPLPATTEEVIVEAPPEMLLELRDTVVFSPTELKALPGILHEVERAAVTPSSLLEEKLPVERTNPLEELMKAFPKFSRQDTYEAREPAIAAAACAVEIPASPRHTPIDSTDL